MTVVGLLKSSLRSILRSAENVIEKQSKTTLFDARIERGNTTVSIALQSMGKHPDVKFQTVFTLNAADMLCILHLTDEELASFANGINTIIELKADHARFALAARSQNHPEQQ